MDSLEQNYPVLAANIALKRAQAYDLTGTKQKLQRGMICLKRYPDHPAAAEALFVLGRNQPKYWKQATRNFLPIPALWKSFASLRQITSIREFGECATPASQLLLLLAKHP